VIKELRLDQRRPRRMSSRVWRAVILAGCSLALIAADQTKRIDCGSERARDVVIVTAALTAGAAAYLGGGSGRRRWVLGAAAVVLVFAALTAIDALRWVGACTS
jgi:hypothetical protein